MHIPASTSIDLSDTIPTKNSGRSWSLKIVVVTPACCTAQENSRSFNLTIFGSPRENPWTLLVVTVMIPVILSYAAVWIPKLTPEDVPIPTSELILFLFSLVSLNALTFAPTRGA